MSRFGPDPAGLVSTRGAWTLPDPNDPTPKILGSYSQALAYAQLRGPALGQMQTVMPFARPNGSVIVGAWKVTCSG